MFNAILLAIYGAGAVDAYGDAAAVGAPLWTGRTEVYIKREKRSVTEGAKTIQAGMSEQRTSKEIDVLYVRGHLPVELTPGDQARATTLLVEDRRDAPVKKTFRAVATRKSAMGSPTDSVRVDLADARAVA